MTKMSASQIREQFAEALNQVAYGGERIIIHRRNRGLAALVHIDDLKLLEAIEDQIDVDEAKKIRRAEKGRKPVPFESVLRRLGLDKLV